MGGQARAVNTLNHDPRRTGYDTYLIIFLFTMKDLLLILVTFLQLVKYSVANGAILLLGDSMAEWTDDALKDICKPPFGSGGTEREIQNDAISGSTAEEWVKQDLAKESFEDAKYDYQYVWLSIGGNDFLDSGCGVDNDTLSNYILTIISQIFESSSNEDLKILFTGYSVPSEDVCGGGRTTTLIKATLEHQRNAIKSSTYSNRVEVMDITDEFVTSSSAPYSDYKWYEDSIHLNDLGYIKLFSMPVIQDFFGCTASDVGTGNPDDNDGGTGNPNDNDGNDSTEEDDSDGAESSFFNVAPVILMMLSLTVLL